MNVWDQYIQDVLTGKQVACQWVRLACQRHVDDLVNGASRGLRFEELSATHAIRWSFYALVANFLPMLVFAALMTAMFALAAIPLVMLGMFVAMPVFAISHYVSYRDLFRASDTA